MHASASLPATNTTLASTSTYEFVEGNVYFPPSSLQNKDAVFKPSANEHTTWCPWKGEAQYFDLHVDGEVIANGAWCYPRPLEAAERIRGFVAFCELWSFFPLGIGWDGAADDDGDADKGKIRVDKE